jgi:spore coat polysaccharide biosynthesis protein SpsF (cytidylyltransferase family)
MGNSQGDNQSLAINTKQDADLYDKISDRWNKENIRFQSDQLVDFYSRKLGKNFKSYQEYLDYRNGVQKNINQTKNELYNQQLFKQAFKPDTRDRSEL